MTDHRHAQQQAIINKLRTYLYLSPELQRHAGEVARLRAKRDGLLQDSTVKTLMAEHREQERATAVPPPLPYQDGPRTMAAVERLLSLEMDKDERERRQEWLPLANLGVAVLALLAAVAAVVIAIIAL